MFLLQNNLKDIIKPTELCGLLNVPIQSNKGLLVSECPRCHNPLWVLDTGFVCYNADCHFFAGNAVDYLAHREGGYAKALSTLFRLIPPSQLPGISTEQETVQKAAGEFIKMRRLFEFFLRRSQRDLPSSLGALQTIASLKMSGIDPTKLRKSIFIVEPQELTELLNICNDVDEKINFPTNAICTLFPYWSSHHEISTLFLHYTSERNAKYACLNPARFGFWGLADTRPDGLKFYARQNYMQAAAESCHFADIHKGYFCLAAALDARQPNLNQWMPKNMTYIYDPTQDRMLNTWSALQSTLNLDVIYATKDNLSSLHQRSSNWDSFLFEETIKRIQGDGVVTAESKLFLENANPNPQVRQRLVDHFRRVQEHAIATDLEVNWKTISIYQDDKLRLFENPHGYFACKSRSPLQHSISNFVFNFKHNLVFLDSVDIYHCGSMVFEGNEYPVSVNTKLLDSVVEIESVARRSKLSNAIDTGNSHLPVMRDRALAKYLVPYFRESVSRLPITNGVPFLGWSNDKQIFFGPHWMTKKGVIERAPYTFHPDMQVFRHYKNSVPLQGFASLADYPTVVCDVLSQTAALLARGFMNYQIKPIPVCNNAFAKQALAALFHLVGQVSEIQLNFNLRPSNEMQGLRGFPAVAYGYHTGQAERSVLPVFLMQENGLMFSDTLSEELLGRIASFGYHIFQRIPQWMQLTNGKEYVKQRGLFYASELAEEGKQIIENVLGINNWPKTHPPCLLLEKALRAIPYQDTEKFFSHNWAIQRIIFDYAKLNVDRTELELELRSLTDKVKMNASTVEVDSLALMPILENFYQGLPKLTPILGAVG